MTKLYVLKGSIEQVIAEFGCKFRYHTYSGSKPSSGYGDHFKFDIGAGDGTGSLSLRTGYGKGTGRGAGQGDELEYEYEH